ncbi:TadE family protein [Geomonas anaerohicana]|uniref:Pilus assembly protein n=1 Tax=Geomonas anaerohicana TaxID=2798583 RepID=A0ABS0YFJ0_9BACT|nr:TadE family protein [Geomonas anaerohicana]MBJ6751041.1 pilus assembly protein [Geomonas anaerohicana]
MKYQKGQALVETAIVIPILILLVMGLFEFGRYLYLRNTLTSAARAAVRTAVVTPKYDATLHPGGMASTGKDAHTLACTSDEYKAEDGAVYRAVCDAIYNGIPKNEVVVSVAYTELASPVGLSSGDSVSVTISWDKYEAILPLLIPITNLITAQASMRYE